MPSPNAGQFRIFLESLRAPVAEMAGLPADAVLIYAQQDLIEFVNGAISSCNCAVALAVHRWTSKAVARTPGPPLDVTMSVRVWTPAVRLTDNAPTTVDVAEAITRGLHGCLPAGGAPGLALVPQFQSGGLAVEEKNGTSWLVADLTFALTMSLRPSGSLAGG